MATKKKAYAIRHVMFEDLGSFEETLQKRDYSIQYFEAGYDDLAVISELPPELLIVLGGPIGAYDYNDYPFLQIEKSILQHRIKNDFPTLGICLGAQLIASALGSNVFNGGQKEIGWSDLMLTAEGKKNYFKHLGCNQVKVLHWHGDTFDLPKGAKLQASTDLYPNQAFTYGEKILALQFHPEVTETGLEKWFIGHANEIFSTKSLSVSKLRDDTKKYSQILLPSSHKFFEGWLSSLEDK